MPRTTSPKELWHRFRNWLNVYFVDFDLSTRARRERVTLVAAITTITIDESLGLTQKSDGISIAGVGLDPVFEEPIRYLIFGLLVFYLTASYWSHASMDRNRGFSKIYKGIREKLLSISKGESIFSPGEVLDEDVSKKMNDHSRDLNEQYGRYLQSVRYRASKQILDYNLPIFGGLALSVYLFYKWTSSLLAA